MIAHEKQHLRNKDFKTEPTYEEKLKYNICETSYKLNNTLPWLNNAYDITEYEATNKDANVYYKANKRQ